MLRVADRLDPEVNTKSADYEPSVWNDESRAPDPTTAAGDSTTTASHRAETDTTTETPTEGARTRPTD